MEKFDVVGVRIERIDLAFSTIAIIEFHGIDRLLSNLRHNARAQSASVTRNKQGCAAYEVCIVTQSIGDSGQLAIKPESRWPR